MTEFTVAPSQFGMGKDEQATHDAFVDFMGGRSRADLIWRVFKSMLGWTPNPYDYSTNAPKTVNQAFRIRARAQGFTDAEVDALLAIQ